MPTDLEQASPMLQQLWGWWQTLDDGTVRVLEQIYQRAPDAVAEVLGGGQPDLLLAEPGVSLTDHIRTQLVASQPLADHSTIASYNIVVTRPLNPAVINPHAGYNLTVDWTWANRGRPLQEPVRAKVVLIDDSGAVGAEAEDEFGDPGEGGRRVELELKNLPAGHWWLRLFAPYTDGMENVPGADSGTIEYPVGDPTANQEKGAANPADGFSAASERFAAGAAAAGDGDLLAAAQAEFDAGIADVQRSLQLLGITANLESRRLFGSESSQAAQHLTRLGVAAERLAQTTLATLASGGNLQDSDEWMAFLDLLHRGAE